MIFEDTIWGVEFLLHCTHICQHCLYGIPLILYASLSLLMVVSRCTKIV